MFENILDILENDAKFEDSFIKQDKVKNMREYLKTIKEGEWMKELFKFVTLLMVFTLILCFYGLSIKWVVNGVTEYIERAYIAECINNNGVVKKDQHGILYCKYLK